MDKNMIERLTAHVENAGTEETDEILREINVLSEDDLQISTVKKFGIGR